MKCGYFIVDLMIENSLMHFVWNITIFICYFFRFSLALKKAENNTNATKRKKNKISWMIFCTQAVNDVRVNSTWGQVIAFSNSELFSNLLRIVGCGNCRHTNRGVAKRKSGEGGTATVAQLAGCFVLAARLPQNFQTLETEAEFFIRYTQLAPLDCCLGLEWKLNVWKTPPS